VTTATAFGEVGKVFSGEGIELVWVAKQAEEIDPAWFSADTVDLLLVLQGRLRVEFDDEASTELTLRPGQLLVLPARTRCRAYRWPREEHDATIFLAAYPANT
jgi:mannose-6-phosphate isomerase-like protein (cupin superfamily)